MYYLTSIVILISVFSTPCLAQSKTKVSVIPLSSDQQMVLVPSTLGIVVNLNDPDSIKLGNYYADARGIPKRNLIGIHFPRTDFVALHQVRTELKKLQKMGVFKDVVGFALAFSKPYRIDENQSITSAFSQGLAEIKWHGNCNLTVQNPDRSAVPGAPLKAKPAFLLSGGAGLDSDIALIQRGKNADTSNPSGTILLVKTDDYARSSPREQGMDRAANEFDDSIRILQISDSLMVPERQVLGFQTGLSKIRGLDNLTFLPGAYADSLTSFGGALNDNKGQTTIAEIMRAGATASYGTVREPCNFAGKFPDPQRLARNYLNGDSILEAYWKSVDMATEGLFIGEPLSRPFSLFDAEMDGKSLTLKVNRQTVRYAGGIASIDNQENSRSNEIQLSQAFEVYDVRSGRPRFIQNILVPKSAKPGDVIPLAASINEPMGIVLGVRVLN